MQFQSTHRRAGFDQRTPGSPPGRAGRGRREAGFVLTIWEVLLSVVIVAVVFGTIINGYLVAATKAEWAGYSLAAQSLTVQSLEQARAAVWDIAVGKNEVTNLINANGVLSWSYNSSTLTTTIVRTNLMDVPWKGTNFMIATNFITIQTIFENNTTNVPVQLQVVRVDTVWPFTGWKNHAIAYYTNSICTYLAPDNRDPTTLGATTPSAITPPSETY